MSAEKLLISRRNFLKTTGLTVGSVVGAEALKWMSSQIIGERPHFKEEDASEEPLASDPTVQPNIDTTIPQPEVVEIVQSTTETEITEPLEDSLIPRELLIDGLKIGYINATNPNGEQIINVPLILDLYPTSPAFDKNGEQLLDKKGHKISNYEAQLQRGAVLEVRKNEVNPESVYTEQALPGEVGDVYIFGHRVTTIHPDIDGDGYPDQDQPKQHVFLRLSDLQPGAILGLFINGDAVRYRMNEPVDLDGILVENSDGSQNDDGVSAIRAQNTEGKKQLKLVACHPPGETTHRIVAYFEQI